MFDAQIGNGVRRQPLADVANHEEKTGRPSAVAYAMAQFPNPGAASTLVTHVRGAAADAEEAGAVALARETLTDLLELSANAPPLDRGLVLLQLGRIARTLGEIDAAVDLLTAAGDLGRAEGVPELELRESLGKAVVARTRGNYPEARRLFEAALAAAVALKLEDAVGNSHHGLMSVAVASGDYDAALTHGWQALSSARTQASREAEMLGNLAHVCAKAGYQAAALAGFMAALARTHAPRLRLPFLGGVAESAARLCLADRVDAAARAITSEASNGFPFESADAWFAVSRAHRLLGETAAGDAAAKRAAAIAEAHGFYEFVHRLEQLPASPLPLAEPAMGVVKSLESWSGETSELLALSTSPMGS